MQSCLPFQATSRHTWTSSEDHQARLTRAWLSVGTFCTSVLSQINRL